MQHLQTLKCRSFFAGIANPSCGRSIDVSSYVNLERHCDDCYNLYREIDIYLMCRQHCYENDIFFSCLNATRVPTDTQFELAKDIVAVDGGHLIGINFDNK